MEPTTASASLLAFAVRIGYSHETFMQELDAIVEHIKKSAQ
jgi:hypothetical protein